MTPFQFDRDDRPRRRPSLTPMIDVVFLLLVFFMLAARFGIDQVTPLARSGGNVAYAGAPRLIDIRPGGIALNGVEIAVERLPAALAPLMPDADAAVLLRGRDKATVQHIIDVADALTQAGFSTLVLVE